MVYLIVVIVWNNIMMSDDDYEGVSKMVGLVQPRHHRHPGLRPPRTSSRTRHRTIAAAARPRPAPTRRSSARPVPSAHRRSSCECRRSVTQVVQIVSHLKGAVSHSLRVQAVSHHIKGAVSHSLRVQAVSHHIKGAVSHSLRVHRHQNKRFIYFHNSY